MNRKSKRPKSVTVRIAKTPIGGGTVTVNTLHVDPATVGGNLHVPHSGGKLHVDQRQVSGKLTVR